MNFLRNAWYCAAWAHEITRKPLARTLLSERVVMYRKQDGGIIALGNVCAHRFAPLHNGKLLGDVLACPYHGMRFAEGGACVHNPHGGSIPAALRVKGYPIAERHAVVWIWMGDPTLANRDLIPDFSAHTDPDFVTVDGLIGIKGGYQLVADNLLDLSHTQFLHPILTLEDDPEVHTEYDILEDGDSITTVFNQLNTKPFGFVNFVWPDAPGRVSSYSGIRWQAPANMLLKIHFVSLDPAVTKEIRIWGAELVTPETEFTCHYFWSAARNFRLDDTRFGEALQQTIGSVFTNEDAPMIASVQENMGGETDLIAMKPIIFPTDAAAARARRVLRNLINKESLPSREANAPA
jgi:phenylpropionate dioxygenase-like ring-hydroxylating dioxygenase large terminal subunit